MQPWVIRLLLWHISPRWELASSNSLVVKRVAGIYFLNAEDFEKQDKLLLLHITVFSSSVLSLYIHIQGIAPLQMEISQSHWVNFIWSSSLRTLEWKMLDFGSAVKYRGKLVHSDSLNFLIPWATSQEHRYTPFFLAHVLSCMPWRCCGIPFTVNIHVQILIFKLFLLHWISQILKMPNLLGHLLLSLPKHFTSVLRCVSAGSNTWVLSVFI